MSKRIPLPFSPFKFLSESYLSKLEPPIRWFQDRPSIGGQITDINQILILQPHFLSKCQRITIQFSKHVQKLQMSLIAHAEDVTENEHSVLVHQVLDFLAETRREQFGEVQAGHFSGKGWAYLGCFQSRRYGHCGAMGQTAAEYHRNICELDGYIRRG